MADEFDNLVDKQNDYLISIEKNQKKYLLKAFLQGMGNVFSIFGNQNILTINYHPIYSRNDLGPFQKDAIGLGSDWQRVGQTLDRIISEELLDKKLSVEKAEKGKIFVQRMYDLYKRQYYSNSIV